MSNYRNYYDSTFGRPRSDSASKKTPEKSSTSKIAVKYGGSYTSGLSTPSGSSTSRLAKPVTEKDRCHPPISYKSPLLRTSISRSRDPSPAGDRSEKSTTSSSSGYLNTNRLYPRPHTRSASRESIISPASSTSNLPKFTGNRNDPIKFGGYRTPSTSKDDSLSSKYNSSSSRNASKEDLSSSGSQKYLNSRFLPKNSVVKSFTAHTRPSNVRTNEVSRKNRELLSVLQAEKEQEKLSRPTSRCSSLAPEDAPKIRPSLSPEPQSLKEGEMETVTVITRSTSPTLGDTKTSFLRSRRMDIAKTIQKVVIRSKTDQSRMVDKEIQSDRLDDSTKSSRFVGASRISAAPWSSFLDMKFSSPNTKKSSMYKQDSCESPKSLSRTSSTKSIVSCKSEKDGKKSIASPKSKLTQPKQLTEKKQLPPPIPKGEPSGKQSSLHSLNTPNKDFRKSVLNMNLDGSKKKLGRRSTSASSVESDIADPDATDVSETLASCNSFGKSSSSSRLPQKVSHTRRSPSTDVSTGVSSSEDDFKNKKEKMESINSSRASILVSSADELSLDQKTKLKTDSNKGEVEAKSFLMRALAPVTNLFKNNRQSQVVDNFVTPSPDQISETGEPHQKVVWILDPSSSNPTSDRSSFSQAQSTHSEPKQAKIILHRVESTVSKPWWDENSRTRTESSSESSRIQQISEPANMKYVDTSKFSRSCGDENVENQIIQGIQNCEINDQNSLRSNNLKEEWWTNQTSSEPRESRLSPQVSSVFLKKPKIHHVDSGEKPWWLDDSAEIPEGVESYPGWTPEKSPVLGNQDATTRRSVLTHIDSGEKPWWLDESSEAPEGVETYSEKCPENFEQEQISQKPLIKHVDSAESPWWLDNMAEVPEGVQTSTETIPQNRSQNSLRNHNNSPTEKHKLRPVDSGEIPWWLQDNATPPEGVQVYPSQVFPEENDVSFKRSDSGNSTWWAESDQSNSEPKPLTPKNIMEPEYQERYQIRHIDSGERAWWLNSTENISEVVESTENSQSSPLKYRITRQESGEKAWWLKNSEERPPHSENESEHEVPLGDRASPEGLEMPKDEEGRLSPYDNVPNFFSKTKNANNGVFISRHMNIDDILGVGTQIWSPMMDKLLGYEQDDFKQYMEVEANQVIIHEGRGEKGNSIENDGSRKSQTPRKLDDAALQLYKDGDYGSYLDLEASISEQQEEFEGFQSKRTRLKFLKDVKMSKRTLVLKKLSKSDLDYGENQNFTEEPTNLLNQWLDSLEERSSLLWVQFTEEDFKRMEAQKRANSLESNEETLSTEIDPRSSLVWVHCSKEEFTLDEAHCHKRTNSLESSDETLSSDTDPRSSGLFSTCSEKEICDVHQRGSSLDSTESGSVQESRRKTSVSDSRSSILFLPCSEGNICHVHHRASSLDSTASCSSGESKKKLFNDIDSKCLISLLPYSEYKNCFLHHQRNSSIDSTESSNLLETGNKSDLLDLNSDKDLIIGKNNDDINKPPDNDNSVDFKAFSNKSIPSCKETQNKQSLPEFFCRNCKYRSISSIESSEGSSSIDSAWVSYENYYFDKKVAEDQPDKTVKHAKSLDELDNASVSNFDNKNNIFINLEDDQSSLGSSFSLEDQDEVFHWTPCKSIAHRESELLVALGENCTLGPVCYFCSKKNSIVLRTQLSVRVHTIIEKLLTSEGRELRRALFSLKQIFQEDKDLVHEFVQNDGLSCLIKVGSEADQNYQNYILRALGQVMLYVDGMNGVIEHNQTIQWLYSLISSKFRLVVKTALKLLLVFVEYTDSNCMLLIKAVNTVDYSQGLLPYHNIMRLLKDFDSADTELLIYATTLINKVLNGVPDQDTYYDQADSLEEQGMEAVIQRYMSKPGTDLDLLQQFQIYEAVLQYEDGEERGGCTRHLDESIRKTLRSRKSITETNERRKSRRHSTGTTPTYGGFTQKISNLNNNNNLLYCNQEEFDESSSSQSSGVNNSNLNGSYKESKKANDAGVTPALKRRRERAERQRSFMREQAESAALLKGYQNNNKQANNSPSNNEENDNNINGTYTNALQQRLANGKNLLNRTPSRKDLTPYLNAVNKQLDTEQPWIMSCLQNQEKMEESDVTNENERNLLMQLKKENTVKDLTQKLANQSILQSPTDENKISRFGDMSGLITKAKEGLAKSKSKADVLKSPTSENLPKIEVKKSENELRWEELVSSLNRPLNLCDMDFTDLGSDDELDILAPVATTNGVPPPPPPLQNLGIAPPPPPLANGRSVAPPPVPNMPLFGVNLQRSSAKSLETKIPIKKNKKTVKLFWKEVREDPVANVKLKVGFIWDELNPVSIDTQKLEHLFESRAKDLISKKQQELNKNKEIIVLDHKRSNAINIGMTKLPPPRSIKTAILKMDSTIMNREGIEKLLTMLPTEEERTKIQEAQAAHPDLPLGSAEQFLLTLASISELPARLKLWAFKLDFENSEREIAEPLMDLKQGFTVLRSNKTFRAILSTLLSVGNFLNGNEVKGFQIEYLTKVPEVKDTVHKHSLLHHLCHIVMEKFPEATDLYSEIGAITRASKVDFDELALNIQRLEADCKASWDHLKLIAKHDGSTMMKVKMSDFLADCAERIILLGIIHRRIINRFHKFLLWLGIPFHQVGDTKPNEFSRIVSEFALEYRTTRERVLQQLEKKANHRERNKTRGKMITDVGKFRSKEDRADAELRQLLGSDISDVESMQGTLPWRHRRRDGAAVTGRSFGANSPNVNGNLTDGDDEILESLVKTATKGPRTASRERKRTRHVDRKSLKRSRTRENNPFGARGSP